MRSKLRVGMYSPLFDMIQSSGVKDYNQVCSGIESVVGIGLVIVVIRGSLQNNGLFGTGD